MNLFLFCFCCHCYCIPSVTFLGVLWNSPSTFWTFLLKSTGLSLSDLIHFFHGNAKFHASWIKKIKKIKTTDSWIILYSPVSSRNYSLEKSYNEMHFKSRILIFYNIYSVSYVVKFYLTYCFSLCSNGFTFSHVFFSIKL